MQNIAFGRLLKSVLDFNERALLTERDAEVTPQALYPFPEPVLSPDLNTDMNSYFVESMPGLTTTFSRHWSGLIPIPFAGVNDYGHIFHWLFEPPSIDEIVSAEDDKSIPLLIWLNGN